MLRKPMLKSCYDLHPVDDDNVFLLSEQGHHLLTGRSYRLLAPLLDGTRSPDEIVEHLRGKAAAPEIYYGLMRLEALGHLREGPAAERDPAEAFWDALGAAPGVRQRIAAARVSVHALGLSGQPLIAALSALDVHVVQGSEPGTLAVVLADDYLRPELEALNRGFLQAGRPWLLARPEGVRLWLGPTFVPGRTACWECLAQRLRSNRNVEAFLERTTGLARPYPPAGLPSLRLAAAHLVATEALKWIALGASAALEGHLVTYDPATLATQRHAVVRRPQCPACGEGEAWARRAPEPVVPRSRPKTFTADGGHRSATPEATVAKYEHHVSPLTGVISELVRTPTDGNGTAPVYFAGQNSAMKNDTLFFLRNNFRGKSGGKGKTDSQAKASALCEAIERYSGLFQGDEIRVSKSFRQLGDEGIHPNRCMNFSPTQYAGRKEWNKRFAKPFQLVPEPFVEDAVIEWSPLWSLTEKRFKYLPTAYCYFGYPAPAHERFCWSDSNGNAAGGSVEEAILQGFMELAERDAVALWWYSRVRRPGVELDSFDEPYLRSLKAYYRTLGRELWVVDVTNDLGVPTFACMSRRVDAPEEDITLGFGAHFDARIGLLRAVTEMNQFLPVVLPRHQGLGSGYGTDDAEVVSWLRDATLANQPYLAPDPAAAPRRASDYPDERRDDLRDDVEACARIAGERGLEMLVLDQTRPDVGLSVVKVVVPGLRHFWARFGRGRLYEAPVRLGWLPRPLAESELNPIPVFF